MPPEGLRPAQLGVVLVGRVVSGHIGATVADLAARHELADGRICFGLAADRLAPAERTRKQRLAPLRGGTAGGALRRGQRGSPEQTRRAVRERTGPDAHPAGRRCGPERPWSRWRRGKRTRRGEELLLAVQTFRRGLRAAAVTGDLAPAHVPYAMAFGLSHGPALQLPPGTPVGGPCGAASRRSRSRHHCGHPLPRASRHLAGDLFQAGGTLRRPPSRLRPPVDRPAHSPSGHHQSHGTWSGGHGHSSDGHAGGHTGGHTGGHF